MNPLKYFLLSSGGKVQADKKEWGGGTSGGGGSSRISIIIVRPPHSVTVTTVYGFYRFSQTANMQNLSTENAERDIADHRNNLKRFMIYGKLT